MLIIPLIWSRQTIAKTHFAAESFSSRGTTKNTSLQLCEQFKNLLLKLEILGYLPSWISFGSFHFQLNEPQNRVVEKKISW